MPKGPLTWLGAWFGVSLGPEVAIPWTPGRLCSQYSSQLANGCFSLDRLSFIHLSNYLLRGYYILGIVLDAKDVPYLIDKNPTNLGINMADIPKQENMQNVQYVR